MSGDSQTCSCDHPGGSGTLKSPRQAITKRPASPAAPQPPASEAPQRRSSKAAQPQVVSPVAKTKRKAVVQDTKKSLSAAARPHSVESSESDAEDPDDAMQEETAAGSSRQDQPSNDGNDSDQSAGESEAEEKSLQHSGGDQDEEQCDAVDLLGGQAIDDGALKQLYRSLPVKNANAKQTLLHSIMGQQDSWHLSLRWVGAQNAETNSSWTPSIVKLRGVERQYSGLIVETIRCLYWTIFTQSHSPEEKLCHQCHACPSEQ